MSCISLPWPEFESGLGVILICRFCLLGVLPNVHAHIFTAVTMFFFLSD